MAGPGALFGEASLLAETPRNATVRAVMPVKLLALDRSDFLEALSWDRLVAPALIELLRLRDKPARHQDVTAQSYGTQDGEKMTTLKNPRQGNYYRLSSVGQFVWDRLDGRHNLKDLTLAYLKEAGSFRPHSIAEVIGGLVSSGFARSQIVKAKKYLPSPSLGQKIFLKFKGLMEWRAVLRDVDPFFTRLYRFLKLRFLFLKITQILMMLVSLCGGIAFFYKMSAVSAIPSFFDTP